MEIRTSWRRCQVARSHLPHFKTLLFLSLVLHTSFAQATTSSAPTPRSPTTLSTSIIPSSTSTSVPDTTQSDPLPSPSTNGASHAFNYYFLIIAAVVIFICFCVLYIGRQKKRKAALIHTRGQRALARDVEGWRTRFGVRRTDNRINDTDTEDGLDERGEAPPPYIPGSKPPSIGSDELQQPSTAAPPPVHAVELSNMSASSSPPGYNDHFDGGPQYMSTDITRPGPVVTASERYSPVRRLTTTPERP